jgi:aspartate beta-hydroxylase
MTFAGQVEQALLQRFSSNDIQRVLESWRLLDMDYEHKAFVGDQQNPPINDVLNSRCYQHAPSFVPGLKAVAWWDNVEKDYPAVDYAWAKSLSKSFKDIRKEFLSVMSSPEKLQEGNNIWAGALTTDAASYGEGWKTLVLVNRGQWDETNAKLFPVTSRAIHESGTPAAEVFFASMKPRSEIKPHSDFTNFVLTSHLPLVIPENGKNKCRLSVGDETRQWIEGEIMMFDTSIYHDAINESDEMRYILMLRVWHPDLTDNERNALQFIYDCLEIPELLSEDPATVLLAEQKAKMMREFPLKIESGGGFGSAKRGNNKVKKKSKK